MLAVSNRVLEPIQQHIVPSINLVQGTWGGLIVF